jgi:polyhydroxyalkanoate synthesis regulator phasin
MNDSDRPTRIDIEDMIDEIEEAIVILQNQGGYENTIQELERQIEHLKTQLITL